MTTPDRVVRAAEQLPPLARLAFGIARAQWLTDEPTPDLWRQLAGRVFALRSPLLAVGGAEGSLLAFAKELEDALNRRAALEAHPPKPSSAFFKARLDMDRELTQRLDPLVTAMAATRGLATREENPQ